MGFLPAWLNPFDVLIAFVLLGGAALGFARGLIRMALSLLIFYVGAVLAMTFYVKLGGLLGAMFGFPLTVGQGLGFLLILVVATTALNFVLRRTYRDTELPGLRQVDQLGGMVIGFFLGAIWIGFGILVVAFVLGTPATGDDGLRLNLISNFQGSRLIPIFYRFLPIAVASLKPWMPKGLPPEIFVFRL